VPAGKVALFEVFAPAAPASSATFVTVHFNALIRHLRD
jgi:hypothetical protein